MALVCIHVYMYTAYQLISIHIPVRLLTSYCFVLYICTIFHLLILIPILHVHVTFHLHYIHASLCSTVL